MNYKLTVLYIVLYSVAFVIYSEYIDSDACYTILCIFLNLWNNRFFLFLSTHPHPKLQLRKQESHTNRKSPEDTPTAAETAKLVEGTRRACFKQLNRNHASKQMSWTWINERSPFLELLDNASSWVKSYRGLPWWSNG